MGTENERGKNKDAESHTPDEAMSSGLAKACVPGKNYSVLEKIEFLNEYQTE